MDSSRFEIRSVQVTVVLLLVELAVFTIRLSLDTVGLALLLEMRKPEIIAGRGFAVSSSSVYSLHPKWQFRYSIL